ncbi:MAG: hypothetical protein JXA49_06450 [Actinobacteria bacterium]|nr:hypothetical protein [Actinomycetota bacterium]
MAVMPHTDVERALETALTLDVPFWPQLPNFDYHEDMYVQAAEHFPGIVVDWDERTLKFSFDKFVMELEEVLARFDDPDLFDVSEEYSAVYHRFLELDLADRPAIRGQLEGPISFGLNVQDQDGRPIIFDDTVRPFMIDFMARRINVQLARLKEHNENAFMFVDEPGLQFVFSAMSGYGDRQAKDDLDRFFAEVDHPRGVHLCGNPDWEFMLNLDLDVLSLDVFTNGEIFANYATAIGKFLERGGALVWGIVPTGFENFAAEDIPSLTGRLEDAWKTLWSSGVDRELMINRSMISPATCCLVNPDKELTVERAFATVNRMAGELREKYL